MNLLLTSFAQNVLAVGRHFLRTPIENKSVVNIHAREVPGPLYNCKSELLRKMSEKEARIVDYTGKVLDENDVKKCVEDLRRLVMGDPKLNRFRADEPYLLRYLHVTNFSTLEALKRMQDFCNLLLEHPKWFASTSPLEMKKQVETSGKVMLPHRDKSGRRIYLAKLGLIDTSKTNPQEQTQLDEIWFEAVLDDPEVQFCGVAVIMDMKDYSWKLFRWLTPSNMKITSTKADVFPCKLIYHIVNTSFLVNTSIKLMWPFLSQKIKDTVKFHFENWPSLHEHIDPDVLPKEYGGTGPDIEFEKVSEWLFGLDKEIGHKLKYQAVAKK